MKILKKINYILDKKQKIKMVLLLILIIIGAFLELLGVSIIFPFINIISAPEAFMGNKYVKDLCDIFNFTTQKEIMISILLVVIIIYVIKNLFLSIMYKFEYSFIYNNQGKLSRELLNRYMNKPYVFYLQKNSSELLRTINNDVSGFFQYLLALLQMFTESLVCIALFVFLLGTDKTITIIVSVLLIVFLAVMYKVYKKKVTKYGNINRKNNALMIQWAQQAFGGIKETKILEKEEFFLGKFEKATKEWANAQGNYSFLSVFPRPTMEMICICSLMVALIYKILKDVDPSYFIPVLSAFAMAAFRLLPSFNRIAAYINSLFYYAPSVNALYTDMKYDEHEEHSEKDNSQEVILKFQKSLLVNNISYRYPQSSKDVLCKASLEIPKNKSVAFIGASGAGKTTLADIILGLLKPQCGSIEVDSKKIDTNWSSWKRMLGYIPQSIYLMDATIRDNIAFGIEPDKIDDEKVWNAVRNAQLEDFILSLDNKLDTEIGESGVRLSGGQRQRIGLARALYHDPEILVLDEATSALDNETEAAVMDAIESLHGNKTLIVIAHRLSTISNCDIVYEVGNGKVKQNK